MIFKIKAGKHRAKPFRFGLFYGKKSIKKRVSFGDGVTASVDGIDQYDINKLFGLGFLPGGHHKESARFGWRYDIATDAVFIYSYCYVNGQRITNLLTRLEQYERATLEIKIDRGEYAFYVNDSPLVKIPFKHKYKVSYPLGVFFGGNQPAPANMAIELNNL